LWRERNESISLVVYNIRCRNTRAVCNNKIVNRCCMDVRLLSIIR